MAAKDDTSKEQTARNQNTRGVPAKTSLERAIDAERQRLLQVHGMLHCLYEVLLYAEGDDAVTYAEAAHLASILVDESVERLDTVRLKPMIDAIKQGRRTCDHDYPLPEEKLGSGGDEEVRESRIIYMH